MSNKISRRSLLKFCAALGLTGALGWDVGPLATPNEEEQDYIEDVSSEEDLFFPTAPMCRCMYSTISFCPVHSKDEDILTELSAITGLSIQSIIEKIEGSPLSPKDVMEYYISIGEFPDEQ